MNLSLWRRAVNARFLRSTDRAAFSLGAYRETKYLGGGGRRKKEEENNRTKQRTKEAKRKTGIENEEKDKTKTERHTVNIKDGMNEITEKKRGHNWGGGGGGVRGGRKEKIKTE